MRRSDGNLKIRLNAASFEKPITPSLSQNRIPTKSSDYTDQKKDLDCLLRNIRRTEKKTFKDNVLEKLEVSMEAERLRTVDYEDTHNDIHDLRSSEPIKMLTLLEWENAARINQHEDNRELTRAFIEFKRDHTKFKLDMERIFKKKRKIFFAKMRKNKFTPIMDEL